MEHLEAVAKNLNILGDFLAQRDIPVLNKAALKKKYGIDQADLLILFGGSILFGCDKAAQAYQEGIAKRMMIVGGEGHTTDTLRNIVHSKYPDICTEGRAEADVISDYFRKKYNLTDFILERESTNCGNNVSNALSVLEKEGLAPRYIVIMQDSTMQLRMDATFKKSWSHKNIVLINFAAYKVKVIVENGILTFEDKSIDGMWSMEHYITLLMGEIPRLSDTEDGYGPKGKNYIAHVDIPVEVQEAFDYLKTYYGKQVREANEKYKG